ncbi:hypothetical protein RhiirA1_485508 [Rhizophagus irregularis]|uniref:Uncharacterized protein n=1 Tax=Rhizophagus irregularis TaxID=588596 RepID=A0A2N0QI59_9GLOM|nr:hypothetical protein RhiirA1_485508 [Rhizophagus irregularis]
MSYWYPTLMISYFLIPVLNTPVMFLNTLLFAYPTKNTKVFTAELPISLLELRVRVR